jgi:Pregnancy-associated plasma protein-A
LQLLFYLNVSITFKKTQKTLMKKIVGLFSVCAILAVGCTKSSVNEEIKNDDVSSTPSSPVAAHRGCASQEVLEAQLKADPAFAARRAAIESFSARFQENAVAGRLLANGTIEIPVVVNVVYKTAAQNISLAQIQTQIDVLNKDFSATNPDYANVPAIFQGVRAGNTGITFVLDQVRRFQTTKTSFTTNDGMKKASGGGIAPLSPTTKLNLWTCNMSGGILGYAQFPGGSSATDGVVILYSAFGVTTAGAPFNKGRTATHELGHWLNLRHIWGDDIESPTNNPANDCQGSDLVADTPNQGAMNYGVPTFPKVSCSNSASGGDMFMNYMDYTDDAGMYMFSAGQKTLMNATFAVGGGRNSFAQP